MSTLRERVIEAMRHARIAGPSELARRVSEIRGETVSPQSMSYVIDKQAAGRATKYAPDIARACRVNLEWLTTGRGEMVRGLEIAASEPEPLRLALDTGRIERVLVDLDQEYPPWRQKDPAVIARLIASFYGVDDDGPTATAQEPARGRDTSR